MYLHGVVFPPVLQLQHGEFVKCVFLKPVQQVQLQHLALYSGAVWYPTSHNLTYLLPNA